MRFPFPERIPLLFSFLFAAILVVVQQLQGTDPYFSAGCLAYTILATFAFNIAGGFTRPSGAYIFFSATLTVLIGVTYKAYLGEPGGSNLLIPRQTMLVYVLSMASMLLAAYLSRQFAPKEGLLQNTLPEHKMQGAIYGCIAIGVIISIVSHFVEQGEGSIMSAIYQINRFLPMAVLLGTIHQIRKSGGRSSLSAPVLFAAGWAFVDNGILTYSKEGMFTPFVCWLVAAASLRYRFSLFQLGGILLGTAFIFYDLVPYSQYGRTFKEVDTTLSSQIDRSAYLLAHFDEVRDMYHLQSNESAETGLSNYYDHPQGFWDRLQMVGVDNQLIYYTETNQKFGYLPLVMGFQNIVPRVFWKNKPYILFGNIYAREVGQYIADDDITTGVSFSPSAEAWHMGRWFGILAVAPALWFMLFFVFDSLAGSTRKAPWGLLAVVTFAHVAPEGIISNLFYVATYGAFALIITAFFSAYIMPLLGSLIIGPGRIALDHAPKLESIAGHGNTTPVP